MSRSITLQFKSPALSSSPQLTVSSTTSIGTLKESLVSVMGLPVERMRLIFRGRVLGNSMASLEKTVEEEGLDEGCTVHVVGRKEENGGNNALHVSNIQNVSNASNENDGNGQSHARTNQRPAGAASFSFSGTFGINPSSVSVLGGSINPDGTFMPMTPMEAMRTMQASVAGNAQGVGLPTISVPASAAAPLMTCDEVRTTLNLIAADMMRLEESFRNAGNVDAMDYDRTANPFVRTENVFNDFKGMVLISKQIKEMYAFLLPIWEGCLAQLENQENISAPLQRGLIDKLSQDVGLTLRRLGALSGQVGRRLCMTDLAHSSVEAPSLNPNSIAAQPQAFPGGAGSSVMVMQATEMLGVPATSFESPHSDAPVAEPSTAPTAPNVQVDFNELLNNIFAPPHPSAAPSTNRTVPNVAETQANQQLPHAAGAPNPIAALFSQMMSPNNNQNGVSDAANQSGANPQATNMLSSLMGMIPTMMNAAASANSNGGAGTNPMAAMMSSIGPLMSQMMQAAGAAGNPPADHATTATEANNSSAQECSEDRGRGSADLLTHVISLFLEQISIPELMQVALTGNVAPLNKMQDPLRKMILLELEELEKDAENEMDTDSKEDDESRLVDLWAAEISELFGELPESVVPKLVNNVDVGEMIFLFMRKPISLLIRRLKNDSFSESMPFGEYLKGWSIDVFGGLIETLTHCFLDGIISVQEVVRFFAHSKLASFGPQFAPLAPMVSMVLVGCIQKAHSSFLVHQAAVNGSDESKIELESWVQLLPEAERAEWVRTIAEDMKIAPSSEPVSEAYKNGDISSVLKKRKLGDENALPSAADEKNNENVPLEIALEDILRDELLASIVRVRNTAEDAQECTFYSFFIFYLVSSSLKETGLVRLFEEQVQRDLSKN